MNIWKNSKSQSGCEGLAVRIREVTCSVSHSHAYTWIVQVVQSWPTFTPNNQKHCGKHDGGHAFHDIPHTHEDSNANTSHINVKGPCLAIRLMFLEVILVVYAHISRSGMRGGVHGQIADDDRIYNQVCLVLTRAFVQCMCF